MVNMYVSIDDILLQKKKNMPRKKLFFAKCGIVLCSESRESSLSRCHLYLENILLVGKRFCLQSVYRNMGNSHTHG